jgi:hypothetical protein
MLNTPDHFLHVPGTKVCAMRLGFLEDFQTLMRKNAIMQCRPITGLMTASLHNSFTNMMLKRHTDEGSAIGMRIAKKESNQGRAPV